METDQGGTVGLMDKLLLGAGVVAVGALLRSGEKSPDVEQHRRMPPRFDHLMTQADFVRSAHEAGRITPRIADVEVDGMTVTVSVHSISKLSVWSAEVDFNDFGRLTGRFWLDTENEDSFVPTAYAREMQRRIRSVISVPASHPPPAVRLVMSADGRRYWNGRQYIPVPKGSVWDGFRWVPVRR